MKHILSVLVNDKTGVVARVSAMFTKRNYNIHSIVSCDTHEKGITNLIIVVNEESEDIEQITKQLNKLIDVIKVTDISPRQYVSRQIVLLKVKADSSTRGEVIQIAEIFRANVIDFKLDSLIIESTGDDEKIDALVEALEPFGIIEMAKTGEIAMNRSNFEG